MTTTVEQMVKNICDLSGVERDDNAPNRNFTKNELLHIQSVLLTQKSTVKALEGKVEDVRSIVKLVVEEVTNND